MRRELHGGGWEGEVELGLLVVVDEMWLKLELV
jgi:hypothetical protein